MRFRYVDSRYQVPERQASKHIIIGPVNQFKRPQGDIHTFDIIFKIVQSREIAPYGQTTQNAKRLSI
jgi:hypothetical protein